MGLYRAAVDRHLAASAFVAAADARAPTAAMCLNRAAVHRHRATCAFIAAADARLISAAPCREFPGDGVRALRPDGEAVLPFHGNAAVGRQFRAVREDDVHVAGNRDTAVVRDGARHHVPAT